MPKSEKANLKYHLVFVTKYRYNLINLKIAQAISNYLKKQQKKLKFDILSLAVESNHVHLLFKLESTTQNINEIVRKLKGGSSYLIRKNFKYLNKYSTFWTPSHFISTVGNVSQQTIKNYIDKQGIGETETVVRMFKYKAHKINKAKLAKLTQYFEECKSGVRDICPAGIHQSHKFCKVQNGDNDLTLYLRNQTLKFQPSKSKFYKYMLQIPGSRKSKPFWIGFRGRDLPRKNHRIKDCLLQLKNGQLFLNAAVEQIRHIPRAQPKKILSIDLGVNCPLTTTILHNQILQTHKFYGKKLTKLIKARTRRKAQLQKSKAENAPNVSKHTNRINALLHSYTNEIVKKAQNHNLSIVVGNLTNIRRRKWIKGKTSKAVRKKVHNIPYYKTMELLNYKAKLANVPLVFVNEAYTSQTCSKCGNCDPNSRKQTQYNCTKCGFSTHADINGAVNIGGRLNNLLSHCHLAPLNTNYFKGVVLNASPLL